MTMANYNDVIFKKCKFVNESLIDELLLVVNEKDNSFYIKSDITIMKELSGRPDKFSPAQADAIAARATMYQPSVTNNGTLSDSEIMENIVPRDMQTLNERKVVSDYFTNKIVSDETNRKDNEELDKLRDTIINSNTTIIKEE